ncbi:MAG: hypothetical protein HYV51_00960 [Parcubacteria group bacterium]|nr:hypothetical protein [Parcubacteria group bacterium]
MTKSFIVLCFAVIIALFCAIAVEANEANNSNEVVNITEWLGCWKGEWTFLEANMSGKLVLTIMEITSEGKGKAILYTEGPASYHNKNQPARIEVVGNRLTVEVFKFIVYQFVREGDELQGDGIGGVRVTAKLRKNK